MMGFLISGPVYIILALVLGEPVTACILLIHVMLAPVLFKYSGTFRRLLIFANIAKWPLNVDFDEPTKVGLVGTRNIDIEFESKVDNCFIKIGVWHILPKSLYEKNKRCFESTYKKTDLDHQMNVELVNSKLPIIMYCHGNSNTRAASHRLQLYKVFQKMEYHTIAFDYRGYADSTNVLPSEEGVVEDALLVYDWLCTLTLNARVKPPIFIWGHSLGTGIASHLIGNLSCLSKDILQRAKPLPTPNGLILEAAFSNLADEVEYHPLAWLVRWLPYFENAFVEPFRSCKVHEFKSDKHLARVPELPVLMLHARDDLVVPHCVGQKLYETVVASRRANNGPVTFHSYPSQDRLGHKFICNAADLSHVVGDFVSRHRTK